MNKINYKKSGRLAGIAFILATVAGVASLSFTGITGGENYLADIAANPAKLITGGLLIMLMGLACAAIAYAIYPVLAPTNKALAIGAVGFRTMEGTLALLSGASLFMLLPLAQNMPESAEAIGSAVLALQDTLGFTLAFAFIAGATLYYIGFYKTKLVPRWLSVWGITALALHLVAMMIQAYGVEISTALSAVFNAPIALQEMVLAVWLIIVGFKPAQ